MRPLRAGLPALLAASLWLLSAWVEWLSQRGSGPLLTVLDLLAPETVPIARLATPAPWPLVLAGLSGLALAGGYTAALSLVRARRREAPDLTALAAYWMCAVLAAGVTAAVPLVAAVVEAVAEGRWPPGLGDTDIAPAVQWELLWGWAPALVARALDVDDGAARSRWVPVAVGVLVLVVAAVVMSAAVRAVGG